MSNIDISSIYAANLSFKNMQIKMREQRWIIKRERIKMLCIWKQWHCFDLPIWMILMMCGDVTVFYPPCCWIPWLMLPRCRGPQGDQVRQCKVRSPVPALLTVCVLTQDRYRHPASNLHHHRNHLYAPAIHIPSPDSSVFIDLYFIILIYKYVEINAMK